MIEVKVPEFGESIQEVQISQWLKKVGDFIGKDEELVELESEKASQALPSPESGIIAEILHDNGAFVQVGDVIAECNKVTRRQRPMPGPMLIRAPRPPRPDPATRRPESCRPPRDCCTKTAWHRIR